MNIPKLWDTPHTIEAWFWWNSALHIALLCLAVFPDSIFYIPFQLSSTMPITVFKYICYSIYMYIHTWYIVSICRVYTCNSTCMLRDILTSVSFSSNPLASTTSSPVTSLVTATLPEVTRSITCPQSVATPPAWLRVSLGRAEVRFWRAVKALLWTVCML